MRLRDVPLAGPVDQGGVDAGPGGALRGEDDRRPGGLLEVEIAAQAPRRWDCSQRNVLGGGSGRRRGWWGRRVPPLLQEVILDELVVSVVARDHSRPGRSARLAGSLARSQRPDGTPRSSGPPSASASLVLHKQFAGSETGTEPTSSETVAAPARSSRAPHQVREDRSRRQSASRSAGSQATQRLAARTPPGSARPRIANPESSWFWPATLTRRPTIAFAPMPPIAVLVLGENPTAPVHSLRPVLLLDG